MKQLLLSVIPLLVSAALHAQVALSGPAAFDLDGTVKKDTVIVPLKISPPLKFRDLRLLSDSAFTVKLGNRMNSRLRNSLRVFKNNGEQPFINIVADLVTLNAVGTYEATVAYSTPGRDTPQLLTVQLVRPAAALDTLSTIHINIIGNSISSDPFTVKETGRVAAVNNLHLSAPFFKGVNKANLIIFPSNAFSIPAGSIFTTTFEPAEKLLRNLPLGKTTGSMQITAPELSAPLTVPFEITNRRSRIWILVTVFLGLLLGALIRHLLKDRKDWEISRVKGYLLMQRIIRETRKVGDEKFRQNVADLLNSLNADLGSKGGFAFFTGIADVSLTNRIEETTTAYNTLRTAFDAAIKQQLDTLKDLAGSFENDGLNAAIKSLLTTARNAYMNAKSKVDNLDAARAETAIQQTISETNKALKQFTGYHQSLTELMLSPDFYPAAIPATVKGSVGKYLTQIQTAITTVTSDSSDPKVITAAVNQANSIVTLKEEMMAYFNRSLPDIFNVKNAPPTDPAVTAFNNTLAQWTAALKNISENPQGYSNPSGYWNAALATRLDSDWNAAKVLIPVKMGAQPAPAFQTINDVVMPAIPVFTPSDYFNDKGTGLASISAETANAQKNNIIYSILQTVFLAALLGLIAYNFYGPSFIGTLNELIIIFLFAFSIDITLDTVTQLKNGKITS